MPAILLVCLGNICRSPLAEAALRAAAEQAGVDMAVESAGTGDWHVGDAPDPRAQAVARRHGIDISLYRGRQAKPADFHRFTHIFTLDSDNLANLRRIRPADGTASLSLLMDLKPGDVIPISLGPEVPVMVGSGRLGMGTVGTSNGHAAVRLTHLDRIDDEGFDA